MHASRRVANDALDHVESAIHSARANVQPAISRLATQAESLEMIRLMGEHVIPKIDTDPVHRTTRMRESAR